ncbi:MAG: poly-gamma-glutamate hydrolase family protein [Gammaproteobacteria bacterium]|nr:poly-gamma-glutamate hydrolase family protein [Gammaproteobacteria bacterium]
MDRYGSYALLSASEVEGRDYRVHVRLADSPFAVVAPHGGRIERGTLPIAEAIAGNEHTYYCFEGIKPRRNYSLHITSDKFDEPRALAAVQRVRTVVTIHGAGGSGCVVYLGGLDSTLRARLISALNASGFAAVEDPSPTRQGTGKTNICNRGRSGRGVQIELPIGLRKQMFNEAAPSVWHPNAIFERFVESVRRVLSE